MLVNFRRFGAFFGSRSAGRRAKSRKGERAMPSKEEPMWRLDGRTVLVTGASGGIGAATVRRLIRAGADVIASGQSIEALDALAAETGGRALPFDLTSEESVRTALDGLDLWGVVNSGGFGGEIATPMDTDIAVFDKVIS